VAGLVRFRRLSPWGRLVAVSAVVVFGGGAALGIAALASSEQRVVSYAVRGSLNGVMLDVGGADVVIDGGGTRASLGVRQDDQFTFGHAALERRSVGDGVFSIRSRCPTTVLHTCSASYHLTVPDNIPIDLRTSSGTVRFDGYHGSARVSTGSGDIDIGSFCGFSLEARAQSGDITTSASCAPQQLSLRSTSGSVHALVPRGRYQVDAESASGGRTVNGITAASDAPFAIQALSSSGSVTVEGGP